MASTREYMDYLDERIEIAPANSEEEYQASEVLAGIFKDHGLETRVEEFETHPSGPIFMPILMCIMFVCLIASGVTAEAIHYVLLLVAALCVGLAAFGHFTDSNILEDIGPSSQSQNVVAVHRATGDKVVKGARPIVIVAHYDTPRESLLRKGPLARYQVTLRRITTPMVLAVAAFIVIQALPFLPGMIRTFMWVLSLLCCLPVLFASVADIYDHFAPCTPGSNDNKSSIAALLAIANKVRPAADRVDKAVETGGETMLRRAGDQAVFTPVPRLVQVVEETRGVRHGADVLLSLGILPPTCDVVYEEPRVTVVEEGGLPQDASAAIEEYEEYIEEPVMGEDELEYEAAEEDASYDEAAFEASEETDEYDDGLDEEPQDFDGEEEEYEEDYEDESYDEDDEYIEDEDDDYEEDYDDDDTPSSLGVWFSERVANIREFFSKNRGSDIDIDRGEDRTLEAEETEEEEEPADDAQDVEETYEESVEEEDEVLSFDDEDEDYDFDDLYPDELYLEEDELEEPLEEPLDEAEEDLAEKDLAEEDLDDEGLEDKEPEPVEDESEDEEAYIDEFDDSLDWDDEDDLEPVAAAEIDAPEDVDVEADEEEARSDYDADYEEEWLEDDGEQYTGEYAVEDQEDAAPTLWERIKLFFQRLWAPDDTEEQIGDYEEEYVEFEDYDEEVYEEYDEDEAEEETPAYEPRHYEVEEPPVSDEETDQFAEDDLYDDDYQEEEAYVIEEEYEDYEDVDHEDEAPEEVEEPLIDPNVLHFDYEEDADILPRDTTGLDTISDSYDLYDDEVGRVAHRDRPQPVEDPSWGVTSYQPPRPAMNIARRAALLDLPDPSEAFVDPLASYAYGYAPYVEDEYDEYVSYDEQPYEDEVPDVEEIQPIEEDPVVEDFAEDFLEEEPVEEPEEELEEQAYPEDDLLEDEFLDLDEYADEEPIPQPKPERKSFWGKEESSDWKGGATQRMDLREEEPLVIDADDLQDAILELGDEYLVAHDIWFVATGASQTSHAGIQAFIDAHRKDIRGAFLVNLDSIGVGSLALVVNEGLHTSRRADRRLVRLLSGIAQDLHVQIETAMMNWTDLESTITSRSRVRSVTIMGIDDNVLPANSHTMDDVPEHVNPRQVSNVVRMVTELIRRS